METLKRNQGIMDDQIKITSHGIQYLIPSNSYSKAEEYVKKGTYKEVTFECEDNDFKECYYWETSSPEYVITYIWPRVFGAYGFRDGYMRWINHDYIEHMGESVEEFVLRETQEDITRYEKEKTIKNGYYVLNDHSNIGKFIIDIQ